MFNTTSTPQAQKASQEEGQKTRKSQKSRTPAARYCLLVIAEKIYP